jgi:hypothetical protein
MMSATAATERYVVSVPVTGTVATARPRTGSAATATTSQGSITSTDLYAKKGKREHPDGRREPRPEEFSGDQFFDRDPGKRRSSTTAPR